MSEFSRRTFLKVLGGSTAALGMGITPVSTARAGNGRIVSKVLDVDVAVVGGGCAGMAAAATAADAGMKVAVFEKQSSLAEGGNGPFAVESRLQRERRIDFTVKEAFEYYMKHTHYRADAKLVKAYLEKSGSTIAWFERLGINFIDVMAYYPGAQFVWHYKDPDSPKFTEALAESARARGTVIHTQTPARELIRKHGQVVGLIAEDSAGKTLRVSAKAVVLGTGGFGENTAMVETYTKFAGYPFLPASERPVMTGDGVNMAWEAGAGQSEMWMDAYRGLPAPYSGPGGTAYELGTFRQPILMVNLQGERFVNEEVVYNGAFAGNAVDAQKGRCAFGIFDEDTNRYYEENEWDWVLGQIPYKRSENVGAVIEKARGEGYDHLFMTDSIEALCAQTGIDPEGLKKTLDTYNRACDRGRDDQFYKSDKYLKPVRKPKFYAGRFYLSMYGGLGGVKINHRTEALTKDFDVIPGLYCAGNDTNSICAGTYVFYLSGHTSGFAYNTGRIAGESATEYVKGLGAMS
jgi:fumarate reductase flavoprotein subunit